jgi:hypothetical protein
MSIQVQCPNPDCGKVHKAKDKYAGMQCHCPACRAVMDVPARAPAQRREERHAAANGLSHAAPQSATEEALVGLGEDPPAARHGAEADAVSLNVAVEEDALAADDEAVYMQSSSHLATDEDLAAAELDHELAVTAAKPRPTEGEAGEEDEGRPAPPPAREKFKWPAAAALALGMLSLLGIAAMPFLEGPKVTATGDIANSPLFKGQTIKGIKPEAKPWVIAVPVALAAFAGVGLLIAFLQRRFSIVPLLTTYPVVLVTGALFLFLTLGLKRELGDAQKQNETFQRLKQQGMNGDVSVTVGQYLWVGAISVTAALVFFSLALPLMHKRTWAKIVSSILLAVAWAVGVILVVFVTF